MIPTKTPIFKAGASNTLVKKPSIMIFVPNKVWVNAPSSANMALVTPKIDPVIRLINTKAIPAANAPPARSFAQLPPIANANNKCKLPIIAQPILSITPPVVTRTPQSALIIGIVFPILIINPAAGMTATTTISAFPNFCQNSKLNNFFIFFPSFLKRLTQSVSLLFYSNEEKTFCKPSISE